MILIDPRSGSGELAYLFAPFDVEALLASSEAPFHAFAVTDSDDVQLPFGDFCFWGNGADGLTLVGIERKTINDFVSSMRSKRLAGHQLGGLLRTYGVVYIVIEGIWRAGDGGAIETYRRTGWEALYVGRNPVMYREVDHHVATLQHKRGIVFVKTENEKQTVAWIVSRWHWWNDKSWSQHKSDEAIYAEYNPATNGGRLSFTQRTVPDAEKMIAQIPGIDAMAYSVAKAFKNAEGTPSMEKLMEASAEEIAAVKVEQRTKHGTRLVRLGEERARRIYLSLRGVMA